MIHLYTHNGIKIYDTDFLAALRALGVSSGDTLFVHSDVVVFGRLSVESKDALLLALIDVFKEAVGEEGTIVLPTFSYSYCKSKPFDIRNSPSTVGALTNFFRQQDGVSRSAHPLFSVAAWGKDKERILQTGKDSFGPDSVFETLVNVNAKIVLFGVSFESCTFLHYVEQKHQVPYRFIKTFHGTFIDDVGHAHEDSVTYFVRPLDGTAENDMTLIEPYLREKKLVRETEVGNGTLSVIVAKELLDAGMHLLDTDPYFLVKKELQNEKHI